MSRRPSSEGFSWPHLIGFTRTLFVTLVLLDVALLGPRALKFLVATRQTMMSAGPHSATQPSMLGFMVACILLLLATTSVWWIQAWLMSRAVMALITYRSLQPALDLLESIGVSAKQRETFLMASHREIRAGLELLEYRPMLRLLRGPMARLRGIPTEAQRGNYFVAAEVAHASVRTVLNREIANLAPEETRCRLTDVDMEGRRGLLELAASPLGQSIFDPSDNAVILNIFSKKLDSVRKGLARSAVKRREHEDRDLGGPCISA